MADRDLQPHTPSQKNPSDSVSAVALSPWVRTTASCLASLGLLARVAPLADHGGRLLRQFPTEDGYLMLTIARNIALGHGMSTAEGTLPTNGTQPLVTYLWSLGYWATGVDKVAGVGAALVMSIVVAVAAAGLMYRVGERVLSRRTWGRDVSVLAASAWFASPLVVSHSMNCLETGAYALVAMAVALLFAEPERIDDAPWSLRKSVIAGVLLGIAFWVRNDAAFLILAACLTYLFGVRGVQMASVRARLPSVLLFGTVSVLVALPWMVNNYVSFGHVMPISGRAESMDAHVGDNLLQVPGVLLEYLGVVIQIPGSLQDLPVVAALGAIVLVTWAWGLARIWRVANDQERRLLLVGGLFVAFLSTFYGLFFGAGYFMSRYLFPASPWIALWWAWALVVGASRVPARWVPVVRFGIATLIVVVSVGLNVRLYAFGERHQHFQVVEWTRENVPPETWIGAVQTGTLGYFHDRTINLDGKVNPEALQARVERRLPEYVVERDLEYLVDWASVATWGSESSVFRQHYEIHIEDPVRDLAVIRRRRP